MNLPKTFNKKVAVAHSVSTDLLNHRLELLERLAKVVEKYNRCGCSWGVVQKALKDLQKSEVV